MKLKLYPSPERQRSFKIVGYQLNTLPAGNVSSKSVDKVARNSLAVHGFSALSAHSSRLAA
jgi:hypothetical protein